ncbi:unnamed protein product [Brachionus calyciflorus]|uniref:Alpha-galactosidase n=1 Tax=Brachionus calyciflorus TaxID=104777 RepID=A0A813U907_9BILA|nr:unnamed protein product [Brachionus calyciflorus]
MILKILTVFIALIQITHIFSLENGLARTPPMGWMTWQRFRCVTDCKNFPDECISEKLIRDMADRMAEDGYLEAGYEYIIVDDCWLAMKRDENKRLQPDPERFPSGIRALADYVHSKGLKFGIYEDYGTLTCGGYPGSIDHLELDAQTFAEWTVDYLKLDGCYADIKLMDDGYPLMGHYLNKTNRQIVYSCSWPAYQEGTIQPNYTKIAEYCNLWRNYDDIDDHFGSLNDIIQWFASKQDNLSLVHGPGAWNDPDMLLIGNYGLSDGQSKAQMAIWSIMAAPLIMSNDLRTIKKWHSNILLNKNLISINQDRLGLMGKRILEINYIQIWSKTLVNDIVAFVFYNPLPYGTPRYISVPLKQLGLDKKDAYNFYETFSGDLIGKFNRTDFINIKVDPSGSVFACWAEPTKLASEPKTKSTLWKI